MKMTSTRPYLMRAFYDWIVDNHCTPHIVVNAKHVDVSVPQEYVEGGQIVLNIASSAIQGLKLLDEAIEFQARFGGQVYHVYAPMGAILAIYAKENGRGMVFVEEEDSGSQSVAKGEKDPEEDDKEGDGGGKGGKRSNGRPPHLTIVK